MRALHERDNGSKKEIIEASIQNVKTTRARKFKQKNLADSRIVHHAALEEMDETLAINIIVISFISKLPARQ